MDLAGLSGVGLWRIGLIERGNASGTSVERERLAAALSVDLTALFPSSDAPVADRNEQEPQRIPITLVIDRYNGDTFATVGPMERNGVVISSRDMALSDTAIAGLSSKETRTALAAKLHAIYDMASRPSNAEPALWETV
jgi:hypothetical protein